MPNNDGFRNSYKLDETTIDKAVTKKSAIGAYILGWVRRREKATMFYSKYVGRSDNDLNARLKQHVGEKYDYTHFRFSYYDSIKEAFEKECELWHEHDGPELDNKSHPDRPDETKLVCPVCDHPE